MSDTLTLVAKFVSYKSGENKKGNSYHILTLSNGIRSAASFLEKPLDVDGLKEGDEVEVELTATINYNNQWDIKPVSLRAL